MEANQILHSSILDILFDGRNKLYGAYQIRKRYNNTLLKALLSAITLAFLIYVFTGFISLDYASPGTIEVGPPITLTHFQEEKTVTPLNIVTPSAPKTPHQHSRIPFIADDDQVIIDNNVENISSGEIINPQNINTDVQPFIANSSVTSTNSTTVEYPLKNNEGAATYIPVEIPASFPGGIEGWIKYLENNLNHEIALDNGAPEGSYTVIISFMVSKTGIVSEVTPKSNIGYGLEAEAIKIIRKGPKWIPANQNGQAVNAYHHQSITFIVRGSN